jgi:hypothetical protein
MVRYTFSGHGRWHTVTTVSEACYKIVKFVKIEGSRAEWFDQAAAFERHSCSNYDRAVIRGGQGRVEGENANYGQSPERKKRSLIDWPSSRGRIAQPVANAPDRFGKTGPAFRHA